VLDYPLAESVCVVNARHDRTEIARLLNQKRCFTPNSNTCRTCTLVRTFTAELFLTGESWWRCSRLTLHPQLFSTVMCISLTVIRSFYHASHLPHTRYYYCSTVWEGWLCNRLQQTSQHNSDLYCLSGCALLEREEGRGEYG